ncbi:MULTISPECIES: exodeoxyribonuclease VII small subunit [Paenibacillus]|uniref:exodeoxyribonuclease VII small subunit n=1 Tax=Paenibacillus TaxID=44249 RepID=UPI001C3075B1|nr:MULTISPECIES: exodeoxyribonuclease VII small subunit [Paenibacillus]MEC0249256.1 exodeoxyribonuclease VII small subunit [Paenibacillus chitinolyticus]GKS11938.1 exodeoxyribonuclease 7 small subunit [Paenibacillus chitinolyticus]
MGNESNLQEETAISFEEAMDKLEGIVAKLESGDVPLEQAIELYQEGMKLSHLCGQKLETVEKKIEMLVESEAGLSKKPFGANMIEDKGESR